METSIRMPKKPSAMQTKEGRVNVPLGKHQKTLDAMAIQFGLSKTRLARTILIDGLDKLCSGAAVIKGPEIVAGEGAK